MLSLKLVAQDMNLKVREVNPKVEGLANLHGDPLNVYYQCIYSYEKELKVERLAKSKGGSFG